MCIQIVAILVELHFNCEVSAGPQSKFNFTSTFMFDFSDFMFGHIDAGYCVKDGMLL